MASKAVFVDRDRTLIEDPGYISDPSSVKLLPGVELAIKSFRQAGYKVVVVTNQSGVARGLLTEEALAGIHAEMRRQLANKGAHLDGIYYCPYHPEGTVERYAVDSDLRKPKPGMLLKAAKDMDIDLVASWMVGDSARDIEAGQRGGCRTVRVRFPSVQADGPRPSSGDEGAQADFTVRNLVDAAKIILREGPRRETETQAEVVTKPNEVKAVPTEKQGTEVMDDSKVRQEILRYVRQLVAASTAEAFSFSQLMGGVVQMLALLALLLTFWRTLQDQLQAALVWGVITVALQTMALTFFTMQRPR